MFKQILEFQNAFKNQIGLGKTVDVAKNQKVTSDMNDYYKNVNSNNAKNVKLSDAVAKFKFMFKFHLGKFKDKMNILSNPKEIGSKLDKFFHRNLRGVEVFKLSHAILNTEFNRIDIEGNRKSFLTGKNKVIRTQQSILGSKEELDKVYEFLKDAPIIEVYYNKKDAGIVCDLGGLFIFHEEEKIKNNGAKEFVKNLSFATKHHLNQELMVHMMLQDEIMPRATLASNIELYFNKTR